MSEQAPAPVIQVPGAPPSQGVVVPPVTSPPTAGTAGPPATPRPGKGQRKARGMPALPMAVGAVNVAATLGSEVAMAADPITGAAAGVAALAAGVYAMRSNAKYRRGPRHGPGPLLRSLVPDRTSSAGPRTTGPGPSRTNSAGPSGRTKTPDHYGPRTKPGPDSRTKPGPGTQPTGPGRTKKPDHAGPGGPGRTRPGPDSKTPGPGRTKPGPGGNAGGPGRTNKHRNVKSPSARTRLKRGVEGMMVAGRTAKKGWDKTSKPRKATARHLAKVGKKILWPAIVAGLSTLRHRSFKKGLLTWKSKRTDKATPGPDLIKTVGDTVRKPNSADSTGSGLGRVTSTGGTPSMTAAAFVQSTAEMMGAASVYSPTGMMQVGSDLSQLPVALRNVAETMRIMTQRSNDEDPINAAIITKMGEVYKTLLAAAESSEEIGPMFRNLHNVDIQRIEQPRRGETKWDVTNNR